MAYCTKQQFYLQSTLSDIKCVQKVCRVFLFSPYSVYEALLNPLILYLELTSTMEVLIKWQTFHAEPDRFGKIPFFRALPKVSKVRHRSWIFFNNIERLFTAQTFLFKVESKLQILNTMKIGSVNSLDMVAADNLTCMLVLYNDNSYWYVLVRKSCLSLGKVKYHLFRMQ